MKKLMVLFLLLLTSDCAFGGEEIEKDLVHPTTRLYPEAQWVDLRCFGDVEVGVAAAYGPDLARNLLARPIVSLRRAVVLLGHEEETYELAVRILDMDPSNIRPPLRRRINSYALLATLLRDGTRGLEFVLEEAPMRPGEIHLECNPGYVRLRSLPVPAVAIPIETAAVDAHHLCEVEAGRVDHMTRRRFDIRYSTFGDTPIGAILAEEIAESMGLVRRMTSQSSAINKDLIKRGFPELARLYGSQKNYARLSVLLFGEEGGEFRAIRLDPDMVFSSGTMPLGDPEASITEFCDGVMAMERDGFEKKLVFPGSSFFPNELVIADEEVRRSGREEETGGGILEDEDGERAGAGGVAEGKEDESAASGAGERAGAGGISEGKEDESAASGTGERGLGPAETELNERVLEFLRHASDCCRTHTPLSAAAYCAHKAKVSAEDLLEAHHHMLFSHSEQAVPAFLERWFPEALRRGLEENPGFTLRGMTGVLATYRDACTLCNRRLHHAMESMRVIIQGEEGPTVIPSTLLVVGKQPYPVQLLKRTPEEEKPDQFVYAGSRPGDLVYEGGDLAGGGVVTVCVHKKKGTPLPKDKK